MNNIWTLAEQHEGKLKGVSFELLHRGRLLADTLKSKLFSIVIGSGVDDSQLNELIERGADEVIVVKDPALKGFVCETYVKILERLVKEHKPHTILAAATTSGRTLMPYLAIKVNTGLTADCTDLDIEPGTGNLLQTRPAIGGNIIATIKTPDHRPNMATVRPKSMRPLEKDKSRKGTIVNLKLNPADIDGRVTITGYHVETEGFDHIEEADVVIAGGKGLKKGDNFSMLRELADKLDGSVGATRDAVDRGWISYSQQIGLSGKTISPKLYIGVGISGSVQHLAGIKTSETIVSINSDPNAQLHQLADFSIVGDLFEVVPVLTKRLKSMNTESK
ncbi:MAG: electron transfer flavoprotein subunit alpha/FixB family protein [Fibrobacteres bacterium]|nr:electron transfer flavoprotein subunit alpha/FixB family protein [Fibrobacterota bacterium]